MKAGDKVEILFNKASDDQMRRNPPGTFQTVPQYGEIVSLHLEDDKLFYGGGPSYLVRIQIDGRTNGRIKLVPASKLKVI